MALNVHLCIPFPTGRDAEIAYRVLIVDKEPPRSSVIKELELEGNLLKVKFTADLLRKIRVATTSFLDSLILVTETIEQFK